MSYWDTSALVKLYVQEPDSALFEQYALAAPGNPLTSRIALYEALATFQRKDACGMLLPGFASQLYTQLLQDVTDGILSVIDLGADVERNYRGVLVQCYQKTPPLSLRTLDALHLASARVAIETEIVATDQRMRNAAKLLGFSLFPT